jgi:hypothetical protein
VYLSDFHAYEYINEKHGSRSKIPSKNLVRQRCADGFISGAKGLVNDKLLKRYGNSFTTIQIYCRRQDLPLARFVVIVLIFHLNLFNVGGR